MKKIIFLSLIFVINVFIISCNDQEYSKQETQNRGMLSFISEEEMNKKINEIKVFKQNQETIILEQILKRNNVKLPKFEDFKTSKTGDFLRIDEKKILEDIKFYHELKLKAIYDERIHFGFTSIQSIADEINFLNLLNKTESNNLLSIYSKFLNTSNNFTYPINSTSTSLIMNDNGLFELKGKTIDNSLIKSNTESRIKQGILAGNASINYGITWHAVSELSSIYTQFGSFINGQLYPSWYTPNSNTQAIFCQGLNCMYLTFPTGYGSAIQNISSTDGYFNVVSGNVSGNFATAIGGQFVHVSGSVNF